MLTISNNLKSVSHRFLAVSAALSTQILLFNSFALNPAFSQIVPDNSLPISSQVTRDENLHTIEGGTTAGGNLFHSFQDFSVPTGAEAFFNNATTVENILTRVTGGNISNIDGLIRANGTANLFLLNPNGLIFGPNARLDIGGSFFGSTANSIMFENGLEFSATTPEAQPLLSVNVPLGLQFNQNPEAIRVEGPGHGFTSVDALFTPVDRRAANTGLQVKADRTLALIGGHIDLEGGIVTAEGGRVELGAVAEGSVSLSPFEAGGFALDYSSVQTFRDINLSQQATADTSGVGSGSIQIAGRQVTLTDGSIALIQSQGRDAGGEISVTASTLLAVNGTNPDGSIPSRFESNTVATAQGGDITVSTRQLVFRDGGQILSRTFSTGDAGKITVHASDFLELSGEAPLNPLVTSSIVGLALSEGNAGDLEVSTRHLRLLNGGLIGSPTFFGSGNSGNITVNVADLIEIRGAALIGLTSSSINSASASSGNAGNITVNTARLVVADGAFISSSTLASGNAGSTTIDASESVEVTGVNVVDGVRLSQIAAAGAIVPEASRQLLGLPPFPSGDSGNVTINTPRLTVSDRARVGVSNEGTGIAGNLQIQANRIELQDRGQLTAATASGEGGNTNLQVEGSLQLRRASQITAEAGGSGNGGNLTVSADTIALLEGSTISANAFEGQGGNIEIATRGLFLSPDSSITASSKLGIDGIVTVTQPEIDTSSALVQLSSNPIDPATQIVSACAIADENTFVVTGNGGLPPDPTGVLRGQDVWIDTRLPRFIESSSAVETHPSEEEDHSFAEAVRSTIEPQPLIEATGWHRQEDGTVELVAVPSRSSIDRFLPSNCPPHHNPSDDSSSFELRGERLPTVP
ncbi:MAG: S-layer family protein [Cyanobacteria bacterium SID2]|nr:S-layer family protein [Cyanobacteria bacterium SID2]